MMKVLPKRQKNPPSWGLGQDWRAVSSCLGCCCSKWTNRNVQRVHRNVWNVVDNHPPQKPMSIRNIQWLLPELHTSTIPIASKAQGLTDELKATGCLLDRPCSLSGELHDRELALEKRGNINYHPAASFKVSRVSWCSGGSTTGTTGRPQQGVLKIFPAFGSGLIFPCKAVPFGSLYSCFRSIII